MKKFKFILLLLVCVAVAGVCCIEASAAGGYIASANSDIYHVPDCQYVASILDSNIRIFFTIEDAMASGRVGCSKCRPQVYGENFRYGETALWTSEDPRIQLAFEQEYASGYDNGYSAGVEEGHSWGWIDGFELGLDEGRTEGYDEGHSDGYEAGRSEAMAEAEREYEDLLDQEISKERRGVYFEIGVLLAIALVLAWFYLRDEKQRIQKKHESELASMQTKLDAERSRVELLESAKRTVVHDASAVSEMDYANGVLQVKFTTGSVYQYFNVPENVYMEMMYAQSKGRFFHEHINGKYPYGVIR